MEAPQEEVPVHPQVYRLRGQDGLQREVPVRPEGRPGQDLDAMRRYEDGYLIYCDFFQFVYFDSISREEDSRRNATQTKPVLPHVASSRNLVQFCLHPSLQKYTD